MIIGVTIINKEFRTLALLSMPAIRCAIYLNVFHFNDTKLVYFVVSKKENEVKFIFFLHLLLKFIDMSIEVQNISKSYGDQKALDSISFSIKGGEIVGFLGPNGAGKSTLMKILTTYLAADSGNAIVNEHNVVSNQKAVQQSVGYLPEHNPLYLDLYVREYLAFNADLHKAPKSRIEEVIVLTGLTPESHKKIGALSKGYRQRVGLATALLHNPDVLILDEPTAGLDPLASEILKDKIIKEKEKGKLIIITSHLLSELDDLISEIIFMQEGKVFFHKSVNELRAETEEDKISKAIAKILRANSNEQNN